ncbi:hypothetical protein GCM10027098_14600 [Bowmanella dokdonensis]
MHWVNVTENPNPLKVTYCKKQQCDHVQMQPQTVHKPVLLDAGRYKFTVESQGQELDSFEYIVGRDKYYALLFFGLAAQSVKKSFLSQVMDALGGNEMISKARFQMRHRMIDLEPHSPDQPASIRFANLAAGSSAIQMDIDNGMKYKKFSALPYMKISDSKKMQPFTGSYKIRFDNAVTECAAGKIQVKGGENILFIASSISINTCGVLTVRNSR